MKRKINIKSYPKSKKVYKYLYSKMLDKELIKRAFHKMKKGKTKRKAIIKISQNLDYYVDFMYDMLLNSIPEAKNPERGFDPPEHNPIIIFEHGKERIIYIPTTIEQWVHHIIMQVLSPILLRRFHYDSYGSVPKKGLHKGKKRFIRLKHRYKYAFKYDVRHFFASIRLDVLKQKLEIFIHDDWFIHLICLCFKHHQKGLPLGYYLSQWLSNLYLNDMDNLIQSQDLKHVRYVDDVIIFSNNKRKIYNCFIEIKRLLGKDRLKVKDNYCLYRVKNEPISFLGFVFTENQIRLRKNITKSIFKIIRRIKRKHFPIWIKDARRILSYMGWITHSDSYTFYLQFIKPYISIKKLKRIVSKQERRNSNAEMAKGNFGLRTAYS